MRILITGEAGGLKVETHTGEAFVTTSPLEALTLAARALGLPAAAVDVVQVADAPVNPVGPVLDAAPTDAPGPDAVQVQPEPAAAVDPA